MQIISYGDPSILSGDFNEAMMAGRRRRCDDCDYEGEEPCKNDYDCQFDSCDPDTCMDYCDGHCGWDCCDPDTCEDECDGHCEWDCCDPDTCEDECDGHCEWD